MRKRSIHPDIWRDSAVATMTATEILLFIGLITIADDEGRTLASPAYLKGALFPNNDKVSSDHVRRWRDGVAEKDLNVVIYTVEGVDYIELRRWRMYQQVSKGSPSRLPPSPATEKAKELPRKWAEALKLLGSVAQYPLKPDIDIPMLVGLSSDFGDLNLTEEIRLWATYKLDKPLLATSNARLQLRTWCGKAGGFNHTNAYPSSNGHKPDLTVKAQLALLGISR